MFGYIRTDTPYLYIKDQNLYRAAYCGACKGISCACGQSARMGLTYDVAFFSVLLHNIKGIDFTIEKQHCVAHCIGAKRQMTNVDELTKSLGAFNTLLCYYKLTDDILDEGKGRWKRAWFKKGVRKAKKNYPELTAIVKRNMEKQPPVEAKKSGNVDEAADATATMLAETSDLLLEEKKTEQTHALFYAIGKWIYLIDAIDDYDKDVKKKRYNPFFYAFGKKSIAEWTKEEREETEYIFHALFFDIRKALSEIKFHFNRDLTDNILIRALPKETARVLSGEKKKDKNKKEKKE